MKHHDTIGIGGQDFRFVLRNDNGKTLFAVQLTCEFKNLLFPDWVKV